MAYRGITLGLYGDSGSGKTTQGGELAKRVKRQRGLDTILYTSDLGGYDSIGSLVRLGVVRPVELNPEVDDPWIWIDAAASGVGIDDQIGLAIFDSGTSMSEALLAACHKATFQIGQQKTQRFAVTQGDDKKLNVSINNEAHYGVVQGFMLDAIWKSTWLTRKGIDVLWTFAVHRGEGQDRSPILGPKLAGKALTAAVPKWYKYFWRIEGVAQEGEAPLHRLYLSAQSELAGMGQAISNSRFPLGVDPLPAYLEPADIGRALDLIEEGQAAADAANREALGL